ncbi:MAG TPA: PaaI family thioesterase [Silvibacterium sp.]|nr:PaaI family thioesterase [Silvibacterium sp.]
MMAKKRTPLQHGALNQCFGCGQENKTGLKLKFFVDDVQQIVCHVRVPRRFTGPPGHAHGGIIATLLDEAMSKANRQFGVVAMTRQMEVDYLKPVPLMMPLELTARHVSASGRMHRCEARIANREGIILAQATALFITVNMTALRT